MQIRTLLLAAGLVVAPLLAAACGEAPTQAPASPSAPAAEIDTTTPTDAPEVATATLPEVRYYKISEG